MAYVLTVKDGNGKYITVEVSHEVYEFNEECREGEKLYIKKAKKNPSYEEFCQLNEEYYMKIPEQITTPSCESEAIKNAFIENAINQLPKKQRRRIILRYVHDLTISQIAEIENCVERKVKESIEKGTKTLRENLI